MAQPATSLMESCAANDPIPTLHSEPALVHVGRGTPSGHQGLAAPVLAVALELRGEAMSRAVRLIPPYASHETLQEDLDTGRTMRVWMVRDVNYVHVCDCLDEGRALFIATQLTKHDARYLASAQKDS